MDIPKIKKLIDLVNKNNVAELEVHEGDKSVRITRVMANANVIAPVGAESPRVIIEQVKADSALKDSSKVTEAEKGHMVKAPMVGTVYLAAAPGAKHFVEVGQTVKPGDTLCLIEAMKMFNRIESDKGGVIKALLVDNGQPVEFDQPLCVIE